MRYVLLLALVGCHGSVNRTVRPEPQMAAAESPPTLASLSPHEVGMRVGDTVQLHVRLFIRTPPERVSDCPTPVTWETLNPEVAKVTGYGKLIALHPGSTTVRGLCGSLLAAGRANVGSR